MAVEVAVAGMAGSFDIGMYPIVQLSRGGYRWEERVVMDD